MKTKDQADCRKTSRGGGGSENGTEEISCLLPVSVTLNREEKVFRIWDEGLYTRAVNSILVLDSLQLG